MSLLRKKMGQQGRWPQALMLFFMPIFFLFGLRWFFYEPFVIYGIKYGVGRMTYVVSMLVEALEPIWGQLSKEAKREIRKHIESHQERPGGLGMNCDEQHWLAVLRWE